VVIDIGSVLASPGETVPIEVTLATGPAASVAATENEIGYVRGAEIADDGSGNPDCAVNPDLGKTGDFTFLPEGCTPGVDCNAVRASVTGGQDLLPDGSILYSCNVTVAEGANDSFPLTCANQAAATADGDFITDTGCTSGAVNVPEFVSAILPAGGSLTTDTEGDGCTDIDPTETTLISPNAGFASIDERAPEGPPPTGERFVGLQVGVVAPAAVADDPLILTFCIDASRVPEGAFVRVRKDGTAVPACIGPANTAVPDPCVLMLGLLENGDTQLTVAATTGGLWTFTVQGQEPTSTPTATPTATRTPLPPTSTPTAAETATATATPLPTNTAVPPTPTVGQRPIDGGCAIAPPGDSAAGAGMLILLLAPALLVWAKRRY
jgi:cell division septation protein DedD